MKFSSKKFFSKIKQKLLGAGASAEVFKNMGILATGSLASKLIGFAVYPILTRLYSPSDFGMLSVFTSAISILIPLATFRYSVTIPLPKNDGLALNIAILASGLVVILSTVLSFLFIFAGQPIFSLFNIEQIAIYWWLIILGVAGGGFYEVLAHWATRKKKFGPVSKTKIWQIFLASMTQLCLGFIGIKPAGLLFGEVVKHGGGVISLIRYFKNDFLTNWKKVSGKRMLFLAKYYKDLPVFRLPSQLILKVSTTMPVLYFAFEYGANSTGQLGLAKLVISIPISLLAGSVSKAYYAEIAELGVENGDKIKTLTKSIIIKLTTIAILPVVVLILFAPELFIFVFGEEWETAGNYASILSLYTILVFLTMPLMSLFNVYNKQRKYLEINSVRLFLLLVIFGTSHYLSFNEVETLYLFVLIYTIHFMFAGYQAYSLIRNIK